MQPLSLHEFHYTRAAQFIDVNGAEVVGSYGDISAEYHALHDAAGFLDLSYRSRLCLTGADRIRFLHGQVTNDIKRLHTGQGCYAALVNAKGKMESDLNVFCLADELLLDFEAGLAAAVTQRLERYIVADDVQVVDVAPLYGLFSVQGPSAAASLRGLGGFSHAPANPFEIIRLTETGFGEVYVSNHPRFGTSGFDLFVPVNALEQVAVQLVTGVSSVGGRPCGWHACEIARVEAGIPRFGSDMDHSNFPQECGIESRAVSYNKGCYIGQEVLNRIHTMGHVNRELRGVRFEDDSTALPARGDKLLLNGKDVGYLTSTVTSPLKGKIGLALIRREAAALGTTLVLQTATGELHATIVNLPFR